MADSHGCWRDSVPYYVGVSTAPPEWQLAADLAQERGILESKQKPYSYMILTSLAVQFEHSWEIEYCDNEWKWWAFENFSDIISHIEENPELDFFTIPCYRNLVLVWDTTK